mgnify:CR=1 FL=1
MRLIDADAFLAREIKRCHCVPSVGSDEKDYESLKWQLQQEPTVDAAPVAHGRWEWFDEETGTPFTGYEREWGWKCSYCGEELPDDYDDPDNRPTFRFCHSCGAKMDGGVDDAAD